MAKPERYSRPNGDAELRAYAAIVAQTFAGDTQSFDEWVRAFGLENLRILRGDGVLAGLTIYRMGQFFGGRSVPTWGIAGVAVPPELRGGGLGRELMAANLAEQFEHGPALSTLYPAVPELYRSLGWEFAGVRCSLRMRLADLPRDAGGIEIRPATIADDALIRDIYTRRHRHESGCLDRSERIWERVRRAPKDTPVGGYLALRDGTPVGYLLYLQKRDVPGRFAFDIAVRDLVAVDADATRAMLAFLARHRSVAREITLVASPHDPLLRDLMRTQEVPAESQMAWMLRIVRVKEALEARGYNAHIAAKLRVTLRDDTLPGNAGHWSLELADGQMRATQGGKGGATLDVRGLAALYAGHHSPAELRAAGLLTGKDHDDPAMAAMFAGPAPWMPDFF